MLYFPIFSKEDRFSIRELKMKIQSFVYLEYLMSDAVTNIKFQVFIFLAENDKILEFLVAVICLFYEVDHEAGTRSYIYVLLQPVKHIT